MRKNIKIIMSLIMCLMLIIPTSITTFAEENDKPYTQMISELMENEDNPNIRDVAISVVSTLTGEKEAEVRNFNGVNYIYGKKGVATNQRCLSPYAMIGDTCFGYPRSDGTNSCLFKESNMNMELNKTDMQLLYNSVQEVKVATADMNDLDKVNYIISYVTNRVKYNTLSLSQDASIRSALRGGGALRTGMALCDGFTSLFYIYALNAGLDVSCYNGKYIAEGTEHVFNDVYIDGIRYIVDLTDGSGQYIYSPEEYSTLCNNWMQF